MCCAQRVGPFDGRISQVTPQEYFDLSHLYCCVTSTNVATFQLGHGRLTLILLLLLNQSYSSRTVVIAKARRALATQPPSNRARTSHLPSTRLLLLPRPHATLHCPKRNASLTARWDVPPPTAPTPTPTRPLPLSRNLVCQALARTRAMVPLPRMNTMMLSLCGAHLRRAQLALRRRRAA